MTPTADAGRLAKQSPDGGFDDIIVGIFEDEAMSARESLDQVLQALPEERLREVLEFAQSLKNQDDVAWAEFGQRQLARAYGEDEPEYSLADLKPEPVS